MQDGGNRMGVRMDLGTLAAASRAAASVSRSQEGKHAHVAQLVEHTLGKGEVIGSIPIVSSAGREGEGVGGSTEQHGARA